MGKQAAAICQKAWQGEFRPDGIHRRLADELERLIGGRRTNLGRK